MIKIHPDAKAIAEADYAMLTKRAGSTKPSRIFTAMEQLLPFPLRWANHSSRLNDGTITTGHAWTDFDSQTHFIAVSDQLEGSARWHTIAHELFHLLRHTPTLNNLNDMLEHYLMFADSSIPKEVARKIITTQASQPHFRAGTESAWEQQAEWFAVLVASQIDREKLQPSSSRLMRALGARHAR